MRPGRRWVGTSVRIVRDTGRLRQSRRKTTRPAHWHETGSARPVGSPQREVPSAGPPSRRAAGSLSGARARKTERARGSAGGASTDRWTGDGLGEGSAKARPPFSQSASGASRPLKKRNGRELEGGFRTGMAPLSPSRCTGSLRRAATCADLASVHRRQGLEVDVSSPPACRPVAADLIRRSQTG
jgi:hypothetical protein